MSFDRTALARQLQEYEHRLATEDDPIERENLHQGLRRVIAQSRGVPPVPQKKGPGMGTPPVPPPKPGGPGAGPGGQGAGPGGPGGPGGPPPMGGPGAGPGGPPLPPPGPPGGLGDDKAPNEEFRQELREIEETIGDVRDLVEEQNDVLHEIKMDDASPEEVNEEVQKKKERLKDNDVLTEREYGVGNEQSFYASEGVNPMASLREARRRRLAEREKRTAQSNAHGEQFPTREDINLEDDHWGADTQRDNRMGDYVGGLPDDTFYNGRELEERKKRERKQAPEWLSDTFAPTAAALKNLSIVCRAARNQTPFWLLVRADKNDQPVARIDLPENFDASKFASREFGSAVLNAIRELGFQKAMASYGAVPVKADGGDIAPQSESSNDDEGREPEEERRKSKDASRRVRAEEEEESKKDKDEDRHGGDGDSDDKKKEASDDDDDDDDDKDKKEAAVDRRAREYFNRFLRAHAVAAASIDRNMLKEVGSPLKAAIYNALIRMGVRDPIPTLERAFRVSSDKHYETINKEAQRLMGMSDESFAEWEATVRRAATIMPDVNDEDALAQNAAVAEAMKMRASRGSTTFSTDGVGMGDGGDDQASRYAAVVPKPDTYYMARGMKPPSYKRVAAGV